jgi:predicted nucleic acid-binding protein
MTGCVLAADAVVDIAISRSVFGQAFLVAAVETGMVLPVPTAAVLEAWATIRPEERVLLELFLDTPQVVVAELDGATAQRAGVRAHQSRDIAAAHIADVALERELPVLTGRPEALRAIAPHLVIERLPEF